MIRAVTVSVYDNNGNLVRWRGGAVRDNVRGLRFGTGLPGGFLGCRFELGLTAARHWPVQAGYRCVVHLGMDVVWWGWVEDVVTRQRGGQRWLAVQALGPWQQVTQRLITLDYADINSTYVLRDMLATYCPDVSNDYSELDNSGVPLTVNWQHKRLVELVKLVCDTGDAARAPMLFAIWEPPGSRVSASSGALNDDPELETNLLYYSKSSDYIYYVSSPVVSPRYSWKWSEGVTGGLTHLRRIPVIAGGQYVIDYQLYWTAYSGMTMEARLDWYNAGNTLISTTYTPTQTSDGVSTGWRYVRAVVTAPAGAVEVRLGIGGAIGSGGGAARYACVDDLRMYGYSGAQSAETQPRAYLWSRDLSDYDYELRTAALGEALRLTETTRDVGNYVIAKYGGLYTAAASNAASQARYRRRDVLLDAGSVALAEAEAQRDAWLGIHATAGREMASLTLDGESLRDRAGLGVHPARLRAGDRLRVMDGGLAGTVVMVEGTEYDGDAGVVSVQTESYTDVSRMLARV